PEMLEIADLARLAAVAARRVIARRLSDLLALAPLSSHATVSTGRLAPRSKARPHAAAGRRFRSQPIGPLERYRTTAASSGSRRFWPHRRAGGPSGTRD